MLSIIYQGLILGQQIKWAWRKYAREKGVAVMNDTRSTNKVGVHGENLQEKKALRYSVTATKSDVKIAPK